MKYNKYISFLILGLSLLLGSCGASTKNATSSSTSSKNLSDENKIKGERVFFNAQKEKIKENYFEALKQFEFSLKLNPNIDAAWFEIAQINLMQKDYVSSLTNIEKALKISPKNKWYREFYGEMLSANAKFDKATSVFKDLRKDYPNKVDYYYDEAYFLTKQNKDKEAIAVYNELEEKLGIQEEVSIAKYKMYLKGSNVTGAEKELEALSAEFPNNLDYLVKLAKFQMLNQQKEKAVTTFESILEKDPENTSALMSMADYYRGEGDNEKYKLYSKKAFSNKNVNIDTKIKVLYNFIERFQAKEIDNLDDAFEYVEILAETHPEEAKVWAIYGDMYKLVEKEKDALAKYKKSLSLQQDIFTVWQQVFFIQSDLKQYDDLIIDTDKAKEFFPNQALVYFFNGLAHQQKENTEDAIKAYEKGRKMSASMPSLQAQFYSNLGETYNDIENFEKSDENFDKALVLDPANQYVLNNYSYYLSLREENLEKAKEMSARSLEISPDNPTYLDTYAWILFKNKQFKEALKTQEKAIELSKNPSPEMYEHLGDILYKLDRKTEAKKYWEKAKEAGKNSTELDTKIETGEL